MFKVDKNGNITLAPGAIAAAVAAASLFGGWMTKMTLDVGKVYDIEAKVTRIEQALTKAGVTADTKDPWDPSAQPSPRFYVSLPSPSPGAAGKRE